KHVQLLLVFSAHAFFLSGCAVETREFRGTASASHRVFPQPASMVEAGKTYYVKWFRRGFKQMREADGAKDMQKLLTSGK
ncbi:MAG: hypothetical protein WA383_14065, partial [Terriglobales bacterium]